MYNSTNNFHSSLLFSERNMLYIFVLIVFYHQGAIYFGFRAKRENQSWLTGCRSGTSPRCFFYGVYIWAILLPGERMVYNSIECNVAMTDFCLDVMLDWRIWQNFWILVPLMHDLALSSPGGGTALHLPMPTHSSSMESNGLLTAAQYVFRVVQSRYCTCDYAEQKFEPTTLINGHSATACT